MEQERRGAPRVAERVSIAVTDATAELRAETTNLSAAGAYCILDRFIAPMTKLELELELPNGARRVRVRCAGVVVRVEPVVAAAQRGRYQTAIFFTDLAEGDRAAISQFVQRRLSAASAAD